MVTIKDVARQSGFSTTTVSLVLNGSPQARSIPARTQNHIKTVAESLDYRPNPFARSLRSKRNHTVGVMVSDIADPYFASILRGIEGSFYPSEYLAFITDIQNDARRMKKHIETLLERRVEGLICIANSLCLESGPLEMFGRHNIPVVIIGRGLRGGTMSSVVIDNVAGARAGIEYLYRLGHRNIAFVKGPRVYVDSEKRWEGISAFAREAGLELQPKLIADLGERFSSFEGGYELTQELLRRQRSFTALMAFDDLTAFGAIRSLNKAGLRVPEDCSVIGFDDIPLAAFYSPPLTTIRQPLESLGSIGVEILLHALSSSASKNALVPVVHKVRPELVIRESTLPLGSQKEQQALSLPYTVRTVARRSAVAVRR